MANATVSPAEIEKFKVEKVAEREFVSKLEDLVRDLESKVSSTNSVLRSMRRFINSQR